MNEIFHAINKLNTEEMTSSQDIETFKKKSVRVMVSYLEIYNENVNDLLIPTNKNLDIRENR